MAVPANYNYDNCKMSVDTESLGEISTKVTNLVQDAVNQMSTINTAMQNLQLSWTGNASFNAQDFNTKLTSALDDLFGTQDDPSAGLLNRLASGLEAAAQNYSQADMSAFTAFSYFVSSGSGGSPSSVLNTGKNVGDKALSAVTETFPVNKFAAY